MLLKAEEATVKCRREIKYDPSLPMYVPMFTREVLPLSNLDFRLHRLILESLCQALQQPAIFPVGFISTAKT